MKKLSILLLVLSSCAFAKKTSFEGPDGQTMYHIECKKSITKCYEMASKTCGNYAVVGKETETNGFLAPKNSNFVTVIKSYNMQIKCVEEESL